MYHTVGVEIDLEEFTTQELLEELESRNVTRDQDFDSDLLTKIYEKRIMGVDYQRELDELIWQRLGRM